jgi:hypothetical protein
LVWRSANCWTLLWLPAGARRSPSHRIVRRPAEKPIRQPALSALNHDLSIVSLDFLLDRAAARAVRRPRCEYELSPYVWGAGWSVKKLFSALFVWLRVYRSLDRYRARGGRNRRFQKTNNRILCQSEPHSWAPHHRRYQDALGYRYQPRPARCQAQGGGAQPRPGKLAGCGAGEPEESTTRHERCRCLPTDGNH